MRDRYMAESSENEAYYQSCSEIEVSKCRSVYNIFCSRFSQLGAHSSNHVQQRWCSGYHVRLTFLVSAKGPEFDPRTLYMFLHFYIF